MAFWSGNVSVIVLPPDAVVPKEEVYATLSPVYISFTLMLPVSRIRLLSSSSVSVSVSFVLSRSAAALLITMLYSTTFATSLRLMPCLSSTLSDILTVAVLVLSPTVTELVNETLSPSISVPLPETVGSSVIFVWYSSSMYTYRSPEMSLLTIIFSFLLVLSKLAVTSVNSETTSFQWSASIRHFKEPSTYSIPAGIVSTMVFAVSGSSDLFQPSFSLIVTFHVATPPERLPSLFSGISAAFLNSTFPLSGSS